MVSFARHLTCALASASLIACLTSEPPPASRSAALTSLVLVDNGDPEEGFGVTILSELNSFNQVGDDFSLSSDVTLEEVEWWGQDEGNDFRLRIFEVTAGVPSGAPLHDIDLGVVVGVPEEFGFIEHLHYTASLPDIDLDAGDYLLSIVEQTAGNDWFWSASCEDGCEDQSFRRATDADDWEIGNWDFAFRLIGTEDKPDKVEICHCPRWWPFHCRTIEVDVCAANRHVKYHLFDTIGACEPAGTPHACSAHRGHRH